MSHTGVRSVGSPRAAGRRSWSPLAAAGAGAATPAGATAAGCSAAATLSATLTSVGRIAISTA